MLLAHRQLPIFIGGFGLNRRGLLTRGELARVEDQIRTYLGP